MTGASPVLEGVLREEEILPVRGTVCELGAVRCSHGGRRGVQHTSARADSLLAHQQRLASPAGKLATLSWPGSTLAILYASLPKIRCVGAQTQTER